MSTQPEHEQHTPAALDSPAAVLSEIRWVAHEARALAGSDDEQRRAAYFARKRALLDYLDHGHRAGVREGRQGS